MKSFVVETSEPVEAVFISDLHLHPEEKAITKRFNCFIEWALEHTRTVYILGDFFHAWPGDDALDDWSLMIAAQLARLASQGIKLYFMHGNRDFLIGPRFAKLAHITLLKEPTLIELGNHRVLLVHGDRYCINDKAHQRFRRLTRNKIFSFLFLLLPYKVRTKLVSSVRNYSQHNQRKSIASMQVVVPTMLQHMKKWNVNLLIHGHTHKPGLVVHTYDKIDYKEYILSDWDENPLLMCYNKSSGFYFTRLAGG